MFKKSLLSLFLSASVFAPFVSAQDCAPPSIVANAKSSNLFSPEQEMIFGDLTFENLADEIRLVRDEKLLAYANNIGARIAKHLPPTGLRFQFHLMDIPEANAYNIPGGHVLLSRKLVAFVNNEDELARRRAAGCGASPPASASCTSAASRAPSSPTTARASATSPNSTTRRTVSCC